MQNKIKILAIVGVGLSGSTVISKILGEFEGFVNIGELAVSWEQGFQNPRSCGCGQQITVCPFWNIIFRDVFGGIELITEEDIGYQHQLRLGNIPKSSELPWLLNFPNNKNSYSSSDYLNSLNLIFKAIQKNTSSRVIVESSKFPPYIYLLSLLNEIELYVLHLVRDSRPYAYSWYKRKEKKVIKSAYKWLNWNAFFSLYGHKLSQFYLKVFYEDFLNNPQQVVEDVILNFLDEKYLSSPFIESNKVVLNKGHNIGGNTNQSEDGSIEIKDNKQWQNRLSLRQKMLVTGITLPLLTWYGYPIKGY